MLFYHLPRAYAPGESLPHVVGGGADADAGRRSERNVRRVVVVVGESGRDSRGTNCRHRGASRQLQLGTGRPVERSCAGTVGREQAER